MQKLSDDYAGIYDELLKTAGETPRLTPELMTAFWPVRGQKYDNNLMVIGRYAAAWDKTFELADTLSDSKRLQIIKKASDYSETKQVCRLSWTTSRIPDLEFSPGSSPFWRAVMRVSLEGVRDAERMESWPSWVGWSNLLKIAPASNDIKPSALLRKTQVPIGLRLLRQELIEFAPRRVLVLTGSDWFQPFVDGLGLEVQWRTGFVEGSAAQGDQKWVITKPPIGSSEEPFLDEVMDAFAGRLRF